MFKKKLYFLCFIIVLVGCKTLKIKHKINKELTLSIFKNQFTGIYIYDVNADKTIYNYNGTKYFTPASNAKIFTLFTGLELLSDSIPAFKYSIHKDTITILGTGDPTFLHPFFKDSTAFKMAKKYKKVNLITNNISDKKYAPGWAWEDFDSYFSPERSAFPMYGNVLTIQNENELKVTPNFFENDLKMTDKNYGRKEFANDFYFDKNRTRETTIPIIISDALLLNLWNDILPNRVNLNQTTTLKPSKIAYSVPSDSLYKRMMEVSDNFLAEQILILASSTISDTLNTTFAKNFMLENQLKDLEQKPRWVDGSGLSRYNLFTPNSFVQVLTKMYQKIPEERLFQFFPVGGKSGTLKNWYAGNPTPYIHAKSGTLGNNYNLSGYLITNSGKVLIFSYMNNHYMHSNADVKKKMQAVFEELRDNY
ncbi:D-alanyl-D-alanine carboxypeptidase / D-alanyl-D-alanine-endopeptidase (penicillin-binding protein 4) [Polaribacter sp. KT25b]|uniref:D-alanyl-D-alanine carboxypeptidase/D-alanyl-D-alanine-endopeptidase n=1 Tax=Polaribacter sp. KT25b TaxID=1855336 RepID=UPI00087A960E|nr:D-alanyl-D-alanine carboxypeptidase [Polaribacter sp. KT25b]SDS53109.1 D-alanyl-D-alanine carboxypeptidase / D-alanyl-D-alanine-endopeptidase (penicillin-binding protein 4) [Polaribacter sp. KT25b]